MKIYNTLTRKKEEFKPITKQKASIYSCGPTVYHYPHLGNHRAYIFMDILNKTLLQNGFEVNLVMNITDVGHLTDDGDQGEDKMEKGSKREGKTAWEIADYYTQKFMEDIKSLNIKTPSIICKATDHIKEQIEMVKKIEENGYTYITKDGVYFDTSKLKEYGELIQGFNPENLEAGKRVGMGEKKNPTDFALWKFSGKEKRQMEWESPWGKGFPGWHIECTAMGCKYLGDQFDIHTGGIDHITVHHTNELAQARACTGKKHANYWMHSAHLLENKEKMSKSKGEFLRIKNLKQKGFDALDYRYFCLLTSYRKELNFTWQALEAAKTARENLIKKISTLQKKEVETINTKKYLDEFKEAINDDLNTPVAIAIIRKALNDQKLSSTEKYTIAKKSDEVLSLNLFETKEIKVPEEITMLAKKRLEAKKQKNFDLADKLREEIREKGFEIKDKKDGFEITKI
ncbi:MAG: cysteine--tRNA ligase [Candidatus Woesearchaeota archaeon]